jgi:hypothetical protein
MRRSLLTALLLIAITDPGLAAPGCRCVCRETSYGRVCRWECPKPRRESREWYDAGSQPTRSQPLQPTGYDAGFQPYAQPTGGTWATPPPRNDTLLLFWGGVFILLIGFLHWLFKKPTPEPELDAHTRALEQKIQATKEMEAKVTAASAAADQLIASLHKDMTHG